MDCTKSSILCDDCKFAEVYGIDLSEEEFDLVMRQANQHNQLLDLAVNKLKRRATE